MINLNIPSVFYPLQNTCVRNQQH